jgi:hypothetical protein
MQYAWTQPVTSEGLRPDAPRSLPGLMADITDQHTFHDGESLDILLAA